MVAMQQTVRPVASRVTAGAGVSYLAGWLPLFAVAVRVEQTVIHARLLVNADDAFRSQGESVGAAAAVHAGFWTCRVLHSSEPPLHGAIYSKRDPMRVGLARRQIDHDCLH